MFTRISRRIISASSDTVPNDHRVATSWQLRLFRSYFCILTWFPSWDVLIRHAFDREIPTRGRTNWERVRDRPSWAAILASLFSKSFLFKAFFFNSLTTSVFFILFWWKLFVWASSARLLFLLLFKVLAVYLYLWSTTDPKNFGLQPGR